MSERREPSGLAIGLIYFASAMLAVIGFFHIFYGIAAIAKDEFFVVSENYIFSFDVTAWGWIHLFWGLAVLVAGLSLYQGAVWARVVGVLAAVVSAVANFLTIPYYPFWSITILALDVFVIWALTVHGRDAAEE